MKKFGGSKGLRGLPCLYNEACHYHTFFAAVKKQAFCIGTCNGFADIHFEQVRMVGQGMSDASRRSPPTAVVCATNVFRAGQWLRRAEIGCD